jgi:hypothetical protein
MNSLLSAIMASGLWGVGDVANLKLLLLVLEDGKGRQFEHSNHRP